MHTSHHVCALLSATHRSGPTDGILSQTGYTEPTVRGQRGCFAHLVRLNSMRPFLYIAVDMTD